MSESKFGGPRCPECGERPPCDEKGCGAVEKAMRAALLHGGLVRFAELSVTILGEHYTRVRLKLGRLK